MDHHRPHATRLLSALCGAVLLSGAALSGHEIPAAVTVQAYVKPEGRHLQLLVRLPLEAVRDIEWPTRGPGYLDLSRVESSLGDAARLWIAPNITVYEGGRALASPAIAAVRVSLPSDRAFASYDQALAHVGGDNPVPDGTSLMWNQALFDVRLEYAIASDQSEFAIEPTLSRLGLRVDHVIRFLQPGHPVRAYEFAGDAGLVVLDPRWHQAAWRFVGLGFRHILDGLDHLLFLACLVIPVRRVTTLVLVVSSFTVAHSLTLVASAFDLAPRAQWFPGLVEALIALSIVYMAVENIVGRGLEHRWIAAFGFGLVHGFGFSFALRETLQFSGSHLFTSLFAFNAGVELGQIAVILVMVPLLRLFFARIVAERTGVILLSALVAHTGLHWLTERAEQLRTLPWDRPAVDAAALATGLRWAMLAVLVAVAFWILAGLRRRLTASPAGDRGAPHRGSAAALATPAWEGAPDRLGSGANGVR